MTLAIGVDIGGTKVAVGVVDESGHILTQRRRPIAANDADATLSAIVDLITELPQRAPSGCHRDRRALACWTPAARGSRSRQTSIGSTYRCGEVIERGTKLPTVLEDDANAAAWAEYRFGAGQNEPHLVMVTVGTGIGGGVIDEGSIRHGASGSAAEFGHMQIVPDGIECACGGRGCLEQYASGRALVSQARDLCIDHPSRGSLVLSLGDGTPTGIHGKHVTEAARRGDPLALESFEKIAGWLGRGLAILTAVLDPGCFVLGGGVSEAGDILLDPAGAAFRRFLPVGEHRLPAQLKLAELGNDAGLIGAADLAHAH